MSRGGLYSLLFVLCLFSYGQEKGLGLVFDEQGIREMPKAAQLATRDFRAMPSSVDLSVYAPEVGDQGKTGTCVAWSSVYHARTISLALRNGLMDKAQITASAFSPSYVYNQIRENEGCDWGTRINEALELLKAKGAPKLLDFGFDCDRMPNPVDHRKAEDYRIKDYKILCYQDDDNKVAVIKKSLSNNNPVVFGMYTVPSFSGAYYTEVWNPTPKDKDYERGGHAMVIVGYDDNKYGGAFRILNSWGNQWGDGGYIWIRYDDAQYAVLFAAEMIDFESEKINLKGAVAFQEVGGSQMTAGYSAINGIYRMDKSYASGTEFQFMIENNEPAYVYAFGSDNSKQSFRIFPYDENTSPYLGYKGNSIFFPSEDQYVRMDQHAGKDVFCILYSNEAIDFDRVLTEMPRYEGTFKERLKQVLGSRLANEEQVTYSDRLIQFTSSKVDPSAIVPVIIEIDHI